MNIIDTLYDDGDLTTDEGIDAICEKIKSLNVSKVCIIYGVIVKLYICFSI